MRVALFSNGFPERRDGSYTPAVIDTLLRLSHSHEIWVFALGGMSPAAKKSYRFEGLHVVASGAAHGKSLFWHAAALLRHARQLHRSQPFQLAHGIWHVGSLMATLFGRTTGCPVMLSLLGGEVVHVPEHDYGVISRRHWRGLLRWCFSRARIITAGSQYYLEKIAAFAPETRTKTVLAPLGIDPAAIASRAHRTEATLRLLSVAALQPMKNIAGILQLVSQINTKDWHLTIAGSGPQEAELQREIARTQLGSRVHLAGWQPEQLFKQQLAQYDLFISLSAHEAQGMAMIEAAAAGLPLLVTRVGVAEELERLGAALLFADSLPSASATLQNCVRNLASLQQQAALAAPNIRAAFDLAHTVTRFESLYRDLCAAPQEGTSDLWYQAQMPVRMKLLRAIRPLSFRAIWPLVNQVRLRRNRTTVAGLTLQTDRRVFHPRLFFSSKLLGLYMAANSVPHQTVLDMGTGSGVVGIMAAKRGARVLAVDVNPAAVALANANARAHDLNGQWRCAQSDLFARLSAAERFDWIAFNPPYFAGPVRQPEDAAWYAGENYATIDRFLLHAKSFLAPGGQIVMIMSSDMPLALMHSKFQTFGYRITARQCLPHIFELFHIVQLQPCEPS